MKKQICKWCGTEFIPRRDWQICCQWNHTQLFYRYKKSRKEHYKPKECAICHKIFEYNEQNKPLFFKMVTCGNEECQSKFRYLQRVRRDKKHREEAFKILGNKCIACDFDLKEALDIHHSKDRIKYGRESKSKRRVRKATIDDITLSMNKGTLKEDFVLLCPNHHVIHHRLNVPIEDLYKYPKGRKV